MNGSLADRIDALLPQTQCTKCGYRGCRPYAEAIAADEAGINQCPPGGEAGVRALAELLGREYRPLAPKYGVERARHVAVIDEARCIGCTLCIHACPVDAIAGAAKQMHTVLAGLCTGCDLCLAPCPVDCIDMLPAREDDAAWDPTRADAARRRFEWRNARLARDARENAERLARRTAAAHRDEAGAVKKRAIIQAAVERARAKKAAASQKAAAAQRKR